MIPMWNRPCSLATVFDDAIKPSAASVANLGISGYGPEQELVVLKRYALDLQPKTIVWVFWRETISINWIRKRKASAVPDTRAEHDEYWMRSLTRNPLLFHVKRCRDVCPIQIT